jgi:hypothetical protein
LAELEAARDELRQLKLEYVTYKMLVTHDRKQLAEIHSLRAITLARCAQRNPDAPLN